MLDLKAHFGHDGPLKVDLKSSEASVLALQMAECLMSLKPVKGWTDKSLTIPLRYENISKQIVIAPLQVADLNAPSDPIDPCLLDMILLQTAHVNPIPPNRSYWLRKKRKKSSQKSSQNSLITLRMSGNPLFVVLVVPRNEGLLRPS